MRIWLDTDIGTDVDDALALAYILRHPELELVGISTVFGDIAIRGQITEALLAVAGADPVPLLPGMGVPISDRRHGIMFGHEGRGILDSPEPELRIRTEIGAEQRIDELALALDDARPDVVAAIGPMTNLGALAMAGVQLPPLAIMGGKFSEVMLPGMVGEVSEWNWHCDPRAIQAVLATDHELDALIVPADVTFQTRLESDDLTRLSEGDAFNQCLAVLCQEWLKTQADQFNIENPIVALHDPLTVALLVEPDLCTYETKRIVVDDFAVTTSVQDEAGDGEAASEIRAAVTVDKQAARRHVMDILVDSSA